MANHIDGNDLAASVGAVLHEVQSRTVKRLFRQPREEHAYLMSHPTPRVAVATLHANIVHQGKKVGATTESRVPHADGFMANLYSFDFIDRYGSKHIVHMMRPVGKLEYGR